jgi:hypothetical protein
MAAAGQICTGFDALPSRKPMLLPNRPPDTVWRGMQSGHQMGAFLFVISANAGLRRHDAEANSEAGPEGALQEQRVIQPLDGPGKLDPGVRRDDELPSAPHA